MPELRKNILTNEWVIIATERAKRPEDFQKRTGGSTLVSENNIKTCPFCLNNEAMTPPEVFAFREEGTSADKAGWRVRVVPNKFPALILSSQDTCEERNGMFCQVEGKGIHEVIIETPSHQKSIATLSSNEVEEVLFAYQQRYLSAEENNNIKQITIFRNHGQTTGASKLHPHSQLIASPVFSQKFKNHENIALEYWRREKNCLYCTLMQEELKKKERIILETSHFLVFAPYASQLPFEVWIFPKQHQHSFSSISIKEVEDLAQILPKILFKLYSKLDNPDYNYIIHSYVSDTLDREAKHWFLQILPRLTPIGGYELGSGIFINVVKPESTAEFFRDKDEDNR